MNKITSDFIVVKSDVKETYDSSLNPIEITKYLAKLKGDDIAKNYPDDIIISADTIVVSSGKIYGKPHTRDKAIEMLVSLSGKTHQVITGYYIKAPGVEINDYEQSDVEFKDAPLQDIEKYVDRMKPFDKAGAYGIQDSMSFLIVNSYKGSLDNIIGFPTESIYKRLVNSALLNENCSNFRTNIEFEKRAMLDENQYNQLLKHTDTLSNPKVDLDIINYYFDTKKFDLLDKHIVCRLRSTNDKDYEFTLKIKGTVGDNENNIILSKNEAKEILDGKIYNNVIAEILNSYQVSMDSLSLMASCHTIRREINFNTYILVIDKNLYLETTDYDVEVESKESVDHAEQIIKDYCAIFNIEYKNKYKSKTRRTFDKLKTVL